MTQYKEKRQQKQLPANIVQAKNNKAEPKKLLSGKAVTKKSYVKTDGFFASLLARIYGGKPPVTVQQSIPYREMYRDGICRVNDKLYTKTVLFLDITYHLAQNEDKTHIFENYCDFLNYFDSSVSVQLSFINLFTNIEELLSSIDIPLQNDGFNDIRSEFSGFLKSQQAKGNNGLVKLKYVTFGIQADNLKAAKLRIERVEADILNNFKVLGVPARSLSGAERLEILHNQLNPFSKAKFRFNGKSITETGMSTKDFIAPTSFDFRDSKTFKIGDTYGAVSYLQILAPELTDRMLADFLDLDTALTVNIHIKAIDQATAIKTIKRKLTDLDAMKIQEQKKAVRSGYDMEVIPTDLATYGNEAKSLLEDLQSRNERMFLVTILVMNVAEKKQKLENDIFAAAGVAQKYNCALKRLDFQQEQGLMSSLPLGLNQIEIKRGLTTSSVAIFVPFTTCELFQTGEAMYYGLNALSNNLIMANRKNLKNPNGIYLGTPGSGKSFAAKREIINVFLTTQDDIIISDPEAEYFPLVNRLGGQIVKLSPVSAQYINPLDINPDYNDEDDPLSLKSDFILSLCELIVGGKSGLEPVEKTIIDRCVRLVYRDYLAAPAPEKMPVLQDLYNLLRKQTEPEAQRLATALEIYVTGSLNVFNHRTNVELNNRIVCFDIKELGKQLKKLGMLILQDQVWGRVTANRALKKTTWFYMDEFHLLLKEEQTAAYSVEIWKRFRKWGGIPSALTQNVKDMLASREVENIFENSDFILMLNQAAGDRQILAKQLGISTHQLSYVTHSAAGEGLIFFGDTIIPTKDNFPHDSTIYSLLTTRLSDLAAQE
ncbi:conjugal transfer protein TraE [Clostridia bacterium]|nr:conjugal transfer protein TraE [Clostridia bacterium]